MSMKSLILSGLIVAAFINSSNGQQKCRTPSGSIGHCIVFENCLPLYKMSQSKLLTPSQLNIIEDSWCGTFNGVRNICCETTKLEPVTPATDSRHSFIDLSSHPNAKLIPLHQCGSSSTEKISGGNVTKPFEYPWMAILQTVTSQSELIVLCGGTLISSRYVLTAAHCLRDPRGNIQSVVLGEHDINTSPDCIDGVCADPVQEIPVERSIPHPNFVVSKATNDIGLIRLQRNARLSYSVSPICLPYIKESQPNELLNRIIVSGWGGTENGVSSNVLLKAVLDVTPNSDCSISYKRQYFGRIKINENVMCAYGGVSDTCGGDSGGPAMFIAPTPRFGPRMFQYGIVSAGARTCGMNNGVPGLYTRVTSYVQWILDNISN